MRLSQIVHPLPDDAQVLVTAKEPAKVTKELLQKAAADTLVACAKAMERGAWEVAWSEGEYLAWSLRKVMDLIKELKE
mgnify:CR=1 FL=1